MKSPDPALYLAHILESIELARGTAPLNSTR